MSWQYGDNSGGGPPKKRFANLGVQQQQANSYHSTAFSAHAAAAAPNQASNNGNINPYQSNANVSSTGANPYSVTLPMGAAGGVGGLAGSAVPAYPGAAAVYPHHQTQHMSQSMIMNHQEIQNQNYQQIQQQQQQVFLNNLIQQQQMQQQQQLQQQLQVQLQIQQQQQRRQEQIHLAALAHAQQQAQAQAQQQAQAQAQAQQYHANGNLSQEIIAAQPLQQRVVSHNGFQAYQRGDAAAAASEYQTFLSSSGSSRNAGAGATHQPGQLVVGTNTNQSIGVADTINNIGAGTLSAPLAPALPATTSATDNATSPSKKRPFPTPLGEHGRSQSMPPGIGRNTGQEMDGDGAFEDDASEDDQKVSAVEEVERRPAPKVIKRRKPPKPMPETMFKGIVKGGLTKDDIKNHQPQQDTAAAKANSKAQIGSKKLDGRPPRVSSSSSLRRASSMPVSKADKKEQERRHRSASTSSGGCSSASEEEINLMDHLPRRRSRRGNAALAHLAEQIVDGKSVVVITGAGLSVGSGIRPFRGKEGLWSTVVWTKATREAFRDDPLDWYNSFWLPHFPPSTYEGHFHPNAGHEVISKLAALSMSDVKVITQNVDGLHSATKQKWDWSERLIEAHGRLGLYKCIPEEDSDTDSDSDEEEDRPVKLGHRKKTRLLREAYYSYGDGAEANKIGEEGSTNNGTTADGDDSSDEEKKKFDEWDRKRREEAEQRATFRPKVSLLGGSMYRGALPADDGSSSSSSSSDASSSSPSESAVPMKTEDGKSGKKEDAVSSNNDTPDSKSSKARTHNHAICRYELEESFSAAMIDGTERTRRIMLGEVPSDDDEDDEDSASDTGMSSGMGSETDTDVDSAKPKSKPSRRGSDGGTRKVKRRKRRKGPKQVKLFEPPMCPECMIPCPPQALLFDEGYHAHDFYQFEKMEEWLSKADVIIFIGTSFKVTITDVALAHARDHGVPVYNFNVDGKGDGSLESSARLDANNVIGDVGETLPQLWIAVQEEMGARGLFDEYGEIK